MWRFVFLIGFMLLANGLWWWSADRRLRPLRYARAWRMALSVFIGIQLLFLLWMVFWPVEARRNYWMIPVPLLAIIYIWNLLVLPLTMVWGLISLLVRGITRLRFLLSISRSAHTVATDKQQVVATQTILPSTGISSDSIVLTRRQLLSASAVAVPPLLTFSLTTKALGQLDQLRIRRLLVPVPGLPSALEGLTIAHLSDIHIGRWFQPQDLQRVVDATNNLRADLIVFTGDLIDLSLADLPSGLNMIRRLDNRHGVLMCEGNHDLIEDPWTFTRRTRDAGVLLLQDQTHTLVARSHPIQILGLHWSRQPGGLTTSINLLRTQRDPDAFPILLAHHPHAFDPAAATGFPLILSGHTHGGQLMLNERFGAGPVMFRYVSGLYRKPDSSLVVSNGIGNWFPLRLHAPAEILHLTLQRV